MSQYQGKTRQEWLDEINAHTVDTLVSVLLERIVPFPNASFDGPASYDTLVMDNKPSLQSFEDELAEYKSEKLAQINVLFDELDIDAGLNARMEAFDLALAASIEGVMDQYASVKALKKHILDNNDEVLLSALEARIPEVNAFINKEKSMDASRLAMRLGADCVAYMNGLNFVKSPSTADILALHQNADLMLIKNLLESGSLDTSREQIVAFDLTGTIITEADRTAILAELDSYIAELAAYVAGQQ